MPITHSIGTMQTHTTRARTHRGGRCGLVSRIRRCVVTSAASQRQKFPSFDSMLRESDVPVLVDFYASWCGPCVMMNPELHKVSTTFKDEIKVVKVDTDKYPAIATKYGIGGLPCVMLFGKGGAPIMKEEGYIPAAELSARVRTCMRKAEEE